MNTINNIIHKKRKKQTIMLPTGERVTGGIRTFLWLISRPAFLIAIAIITTTAIFYFNMIDNFVLWSIVLASAVVATLIIVIRYKNKGKLHITEYMAKRWNDFSWSLEYFGNYCASQVDKVTERTKDDLDASIKLFCQIGQALIDLKVYTESDKSKVNIFSGEIYKQIILAEFHTDLINESGIGYILLRASSQEMNKKVASINEREISWRLTEAGYRDWEVERISNDESLIIFILRDTTNSKAYDFTD